MHKTPIKGKKNTHDESEVQAIHPSVTPCCAVTQALVYKLYVRQSTRAEFAELAVVAGQPSVPGACCRRDGRGRTEEDWGTTREEGSNHEEVWLRGGGVSEGEYLRSSTSDAAVLPSLTPINLGTWNTILISVLTSDFLRLSSYLAELAVLFYPRVRSSFLDINLVIWISSST